MNAARDRAQTQSKARKPKRKRARVNPDKQGNISARLKEWKPDYNYTLIREGIALSKHPRILYEAHELKEKHLYIYQSTKQNAPRNGEMYDSRFVAVLKISTPNDNRMVEPTLPFLEQIYDKELFDYSRRHHINEDGTPYITDKYLRRLEGTRKSGKKRQKTSNMSGKRKRGSKRDDTTQKEWLQQAKQRANSDYIPLDYRHTFGIDAVPNREMPVSATVNALAPIEKIRAVSKDPMSVIRRIKEIPMPKPISDEHLLQRMPEQSMKKRRRNRKSGPEDEDILVTSVFGYQEPEKVAESPPPASRVEEEEDEDLFGESIVEQNKKRHRWVMAFVAHLLESNRAPLILSKIPARVAGLVEKGREAIQQGSAEPVDVLSNIMSAKETREELDLLGYFMDYLSLRIGETFEVLYMK